VASSSLSYEDLQERFLERTRFFTEIDRDKSRRIAAHQNQSDSVYDDGEDYEFQLKGINKQKWEYEIPFFL
jgi:hypothetical protein